MAFNRDTDSLKDSFEVAKPDYARHADEMAQANLAQRQKDEAGLKSGSTENIHLTAAAASKEAQGSIQDKAEKQAKQRAVDMLYLDLC